MAGRARGAPARAARRAGRDRVPARALHDLGVLVPVRRRQAAVDERDGTGHGDPGTVAGVRAARRSVVPARSRGAGSVRSRRARRSASRVAGRDGGNHYLLYSFSRGLRVLNAFAQSLNGLYDYATISQHERALQAVREGRAVAARGAAGLRHRRPGRSTRSAARRRRSSTTSSRPTSSAELCEKLGPDPYCDAAARFEGYQGESPRLELEDLAARRGQRPVRALRRSPSARPCG